MEKEVREISFVNIHNLHSLSNANRVIKWMFMRWATHTASMKKDECIDLYKFYFSENLNGTEHLRELEIEGRLLLKWI